MSAGVNKATELLKPMLKSPISQLLISFVVGYYATTKIVEFYNNVHNNDKSEPNSESDSAELSNSEKILPEKKAALYLTPQELMAYDGFNVERPIYTALNGKIYDLSEARANFEPRGPYSLLSGCDANKVLEIACGTMGVSTDDIIHKWEKSLNAEFNVIGYLVEGEKSTSDERTSEMELNSITETKNITHSNLKLEYKK